VQADRVAGPHAALDQQVREAAGVAPQLVEGQRPVGAVDGLEERDAVGPAAGRPVEEGGDRDVGDLEDRDREGAVGAAMIGTLGALRTREH
jgi:hypothetical protein